jgi:hypothetical protein
LKIEKITSWLGLFANIGLLGGLLLVAFQIKQSNDFAYAANSTVAYQQETDKWLAEMGENPAAVLTKARLHPRNLTPEEVWIVTSEVRWVISMFRRNARMEEVGIFPRRWRETILPADAAEIGKNPVAREFLLTMDSGEDWLLEMQRIAAEQPSEDTEFVKFLRRFETGISEEHVDR